MLATRWCRRKQDGFKMFIVMLEAAAICRQKMKVAGTRKLCIWVADFITIVILIFFFGRNDTLGLASSIKYF